MILDELRPKNFEYDDLLKMLDPFNFDCSVPSRYFDKYLTTKIIIITSPYNPRDFYDGYYTAKIDSFKQLNRRIDETICIDKTIISAVEYNEIGYDKFGSAIYKYNLIDSSPNMFAPPTASLVKKGEVFKEIKRLK